MSNDKGVPLFTEKFIEDNFREVSLMKGTWENIAEYLKKSKDKLKRDIGKEIDRQIKQQGGY